LLYRNNGDGTFSDMSMTAGSGIRMSSAARGLAIADFWNDGRISAAISNINETPNLLVNRSPDRNHWVGLKLVGTRSNRDAIGARITVKTGSRMQVDEARSGSSYLSQSDLRSHFGLGQSDRIEFVEVRWPSGLVERFEGLVVDRIHTVKEGSGKVTMVH
jgi:hypothetical protein